MRWIQESEVGSIMENLLEVRDLHVHFPRSGSIVKAVNGISYDVRKGEILGVVGESGSGKSIGVKALMGLVPKPGIIVRGMSAFMGKDLFTLKGRELQEIRGRHISMIFQDPMSSFNPTMRIGRQIKEPLLWQGICGKREAKERAIRLLDRVGIPSPEQRYSEYPFQFSGGMRQRAMIAMAIATGPKLLIADEPTTALDVTVQAQILELLSDMRNELDMSIILITHDFGVAAQYCDRIIVMYAGRIVESAPIGQFLSDPAHPYSKSLLQSTPVLGSKKPPEPIAGSPPNMGEEIIGCAFAPRCPMATGDCRRGSAPVLSKIGEQHEVACWKVEGTEGGKSHVHTSA